MPTATDLLPLRDIVRPKAERPNLVENIQTALADPVRTLRDYLFTPGIRGHFDRIFRDLDEGRGGGYWVQAEYGGGKTHFLSTLLCLLGEVEPGEQERESVWNAVGDSDLRTTWERRVMPKQLLGAHLSLMGTAAVVGAMQPRLLDLIDGAIIDALDRHQIRDPGIRASSEVFDNYQKLQPAIRDVLEAAYRNQHQMSVQEHRDEYADDAKTATLLVQLGEKLSIDLLQNRQVQDHARHVLKLVQSLGFDGLAIVIDEYLSRDSALGDAQKDEDGAVLETLGFKLGRDARLPIYVVVASQGAMPAKLKERFDPLVLLRDQDKEYSQIVCKRVMDYLPTIAEQAVLYHAHFAKAFQSVRRATQADTREVFPFQQAVFRYLRDLVGSHRISNAPSARFAIGVAYDTIAAQGTLDATRFVTTSDLMAGSLERELLGAPEMQDSAAALRQARDFINTTEWEVAPFHGLAHRILNHLFLDSAVRDQPQTIDQIVEGTLIEAPGGMLPPKDVARAILRKLQSCEQIEAKADTWRFAARVTEGEQFETVFQKTRRLIPKTDPRVEEKWIELLTAPLQVTVGTPTFLSAAVSGLRIETDHLGLQFPGRASYAAGNLATQLTPLSRMTQAERIRILVVPRRPEPLPAITDVAIAVVVPGDLPDAALDDLRGIVACQDIIEEYSRRLEAGADKVRSAAEQKSRELTKLIIGRQREVYREGEVLTKDRLPLPAKQLFRESLKAGVEAIAQQLVRNAYGSLPTLLNTSAVKKGTLATADVQKIFDGIFGGVTEQKTKGAAEVFGPLLGLSTSKDPTKLVANAGPAPDAFAVFITARLPGPVHMDELYDNFCNEPFGLSANLVDLFVMACIGLGKPQALELRLPSSYPLELRDRRSFRGPVRASQLKNLAWPKDGLKGCQIVQSNEITWNDLAPIAQAIDPQRFALTTDQREIESQQAAFIERLDDLHVQLGNTAKALRALSEASGSLLGPDTVGVMTRLRDFSALREEFDRERAIRFVSETWGEGKVEDLKADVQRLAWLSQLVGEAPKLAGQLSWFRALTAAEPDGLESEIALAQPLLTLDHVTGGPGAGAMASKAAEVLHAHFMARYRAEHKHFVAWQCEQSAAVAGSMELLPALEHLNDIAQLGPVDLAGARAELERQSMRLTPCSAGDNPNVGTAISCLSCGYLMGSLIGRDPVGVSAEKAVADAIARRTRALGNGHIAAILGAAGDNDLVALVSAAQGTVKEILEKDLLTDDLVRRINEILAQAKQQTVATGRAYRFLQEHPSITKPMVDSWLQQLREQILASFEEAEADNPGKEITVLLRELDAN